MDSTTYPLASPPSDSPRKNEKADFNEILYQAAVGFPEDDKLKANFKLREELLRDYLIIDFQQQRMAGQIQNEVKKLNKKINAAVIEVNLYDARVSIINSCLNSKSPNEYKKIEPILDGFIGAIAKIKQSINQKDFKENKERRTVRKDSKEPVSIEIMIAEFLTVIDAPYSTTAERVHPQRWALLNLFLDKLNDKIRLLKKEIQKEVNRLHVQKFLEEEQSRLRRKHHYLSAIVEKRRFRLEDLSEMIQESQSGAQDAKEKKHRHIKLLAEETKLSSMQVPKKFDITTLIYRKTIAQLVLEAKFIPGLCIAVEANYLRKSMQVLKSVRAEFQMTQPPTRSASIVDLSSSALPTTALMDEGPEVDALSNLPAGGIVQMRPARRRNSMSPGGFTFRVGSSSVRMDKPFELLTPKEERRAILYITIELNEQCLAVKKNILYYFIILESFTELYARLNYLAKNAWFDQDQLKADLVTIKRIISYLSEMEQINSYNSAELHQFCRDLLHGSLPQFTGRYPLIGWFGRSKRGQLADNLLESLPHKLIEIDRLKETEVDEELIRRNFSPQFFSPVITDYNNDLHNSILDALRTGSRVKLGVELNNEDNEHLQTQTNDQNRTPLEDLAIIQYQHYQNKFAQVFSRLKIVKDKLMETILYLENLLTQFKTGDKDYILAQQKLSAIKDVLENGLFSLAGADHSLQDFIRFANSQVQRFVKENQAMQKHRGWIGYLLFQTPESKRKLSQVVFEEKDFVSGTRLI